MFSNYDLQSFENVSFAQFYWKKHDLVFQGKRFAVFFFSLIFKAGADWLVSVSHDTAVVELGGGVPGTLVFQLLLSNPADTQNVYMTTSKVFLLFARQSHNS